MFVNGWEVRVWVWVVGELCIEMTIVDEAPLIHLLISGKPTKIIPEHFCDIGWTQVTIYEDFTCFEHSETGPK